jgi:transcriptional regulator GlxA family with amidase domain
VLADGASGLQWAADVANTSPRTLRRRLRNAGLSWSGLVEQTRFDTARRLLEGSDLELRHIARQVGYADPANFNRAFRRWTGLAPSHYSSVLRIRSVSPAWGLRGFARPRPPRGRHRLPGVISTTG